MHSVRMRTTTVGVIMTQNKMNHIMYSNVKLKTLMVRRLWAGYQVNLSTYGYSDMYCRPRNHFPFGTECVSVCHIA